MKYSENQPKLSKTQKSQHSKLQNIKKEDLVKRTNNKIMKIKNSNMKTAQNQPKLFKDELKQKDMILEYKEKIKKQDIKISEYEEKIRKLKTVVKVLSEENERKELRIQNMRQEMDYLKAILLKRKRNKIVRK